MRVLTPGHRYILRDFESNEESQTIQFIEKQAHPHVVGRLETLRDGTTNEEVLKMLIDRLQFLHEKLPSHESWIAIGKLKEALFWLEERTRERQNRGVEGTNLP